MARRRLTRDEQREQTRIRLLDAAERVLAKRGYADASVEEVAALAGFSRGAVYSNFKSKEDLFFACFDDVLAKRLPELFGAVRAAGKTESPTSTARTGGGLFGLFMGEDLEWFRVYVDFLAQAGRTPRLRKRVAERVRAIHDTVRELIETIARDTDMPLPASSDLLATAALSMSEGFALRRLVDPAKYPEEMNQDLLGLLFGGVAALSEASEGL